MRRFQAHTPRELGTILLNFEGSEPSLRTDPLQVLEALAVGAKDICQHEPYEDCMQVLHEGRDYLKQYKKQLNKQLELHNQQLSDPRERAQFKQSLLIDERETRQNVQGDVMETFLSAQDAEDSRRRVAVRYL